MWWYEHEEDLDLLMVPGEVMECNDYLTEFEEDVTDWLAYSWRTTDYFQEKVRIILSELQVRAIRARMGEELMNERDSC